MTTHRENSRQNTNEHSYGRLYQPSPEKASSSTSTLSDALHTIPSRPNSKHAGLGWRPFTLKAPFLLGFLALTIAIIATLEFLLRRSQSVGAVAFTSSAAPLVEHVINYTPVLVAVIYGLIWAGVDHDVKRLEPYFQLAKPGGALAEDSLFLEYTYVWHLWAPITAAGRRHWRVFLSAGIMVLIMSGVAPLMSVLFSKEQNIDHRDTIPIQMASFKPLDQQAGNLTTAFAYNAYSVQYLNGSLPPFTSKEFAALPFYPDQFHKQETNEIWTAESTIFEASLECEEAKVQYMGSGNTSSPNFSITGNCSFALGTLYYTTSHLWSQYPYLTDMVDMREIARVHEELAEYPACTDMKRDRLFGVWGRANLTSGSGPTGVICDAIYTKQKARVMVDSETKHILEIERLGEKSTIETLNTTNWERMVLGQITSASTDAFNVSITDESKWKMPSHAYQMLKRDQFRTDEDPDPESDTTDTAINVFMKFPESFVPFGLTQIQDLDSLFDYKVLQKMFSDTYRFLFAFGIGAELTTFPENDNAATAERSYKAEGLVMDFAWTRALQSLLALIAIMSTALLALLWHRPSGISEDPGSIAASISRVDTNLLEAFEGAEFMSPKKFKSYICGKGIHYEIKDQNIRACKMEDDLGVGVPIVESQFAFQGYNSALGHLDTTRVMLTKPRSLTLYSGVAVTTLILGSGILLTVLFARNRQWKGFEYPENSFLFNLYASYTPTIAATLFEGFLALLASHVTILFPFKMLSRGNATYRQLTVNYENSPPHLQTLNGIRRRNYVLAFLSTTVLLANVLAVALGGLFVKDVAFLDEIGNVVLDGTLDALQSFNASGPPLVPGDRFHGLYDNEFLYVSNGNTNSFKRRPWKNDEFFFIPFSDPEGQQRRYNYSAETLGIGISPHCEAVPTIVRTFFSDRGRVTADELASAENKTIVLGQPREQGLMQFWTMGSKNDSSSPFSYEQSKDRKIYSEMVPYSYDKTVMGDWHFVGFWSEFAWKRTSGMAIEGLGGISEVMGETRSGCFPFNTSTPTAELVSNNIMGCSLKPRVVRARIDVPDLSLGLVDENIVIVEEDIDIPRSKSNLTGLAAIIDTFQEMAFRSTMTQGIVNRNELTPFIKHDPRPDSWLSLLIQQEAQKENPDFDLYHYPELSRRAMERVYRRIFATYMELHTADFFQNVTGDTVEARFKRRETERVFMTPAAYYLAIVLIGLSLPAVVWTYFSLYSAFLVHQPVSIAGTIAACYSSGVVDDLAGTEAVGIKQRERRLKRTGNTYGYGWHVGRDGKKHFGIDKEPLLR